MWLSLALLGCAPEPFPSAFDWRIDRTRVVAVRVTPVHASWIEPRRIEALTLSPHELRSETVEVCGLRDDVAVDVRDAACFAEPSLVEPVADRVPATWRVPDLSEVPCGWVDDLGCVSNVPLMVTARTDVDEGRGMVIAELSTTWTQPPTSDPDPATADPRLVVLEGEPVADGEVRLRFGVTEGYDRFAWYVDDGELLATGRTGIHGILGSRVWTENRLRIPPGWAGPLRVAVVAFALDDGVAPSWVVSTLEVE